MNTTANTHIRWMIRRDMPTVLNIEWACFEFPWDEEAFMGCLRNRNCIGMVTERDDEIVGYMLYELHRPYIRLLNFAVHPSHHRSGVGAAMVDKLLGKLSEQRRKRIELEIRETNLNAQLFFRQMGFVCTHTMSRFYADTDEDAYAFKYTMGK
jgi:[ribosomal protein S18]-alanine N-acetyltransferase